MNPVNSTVVCVEPAVLCTADVKVFFGGNENFLRLRCNDWIRPLPGKDRGMDYALEDLRVAIARVRLEGWPPLARGQSSKPASDT